MMKSYSNTFRFKKCTLTLFCGAFIWFLFCSPSLSQITGFTLKEGKAERTYYVAPGGNGDGSAVNPFGNIDQALKAALVYRAGSDKNVKVLVRDGIYRQTVIVTEAQKFTGKSLLIFEAEHPGKVTISGARELKDWRLLSNRDRAIFWTDLPDEYIKSLTQSQNRTVPNGRVPNPWPKNVKTLGGMLINGQLRMGNNYYFPSPSLDSITIGSFFLDYSAKKIYVKLISKEGMDKSDLAIAPTVFNLSNNNNIIMRGINVEHAGWAFSTAARLANIENLLVENCNFNNNRYGGLGAGMLKNTTFRNVEMCHNGGKGGGGDWGTNGYLRNIICDKIKVNYNNWINYQYGWLGWDPCGIKFAAVRQMLIKDSEFIGNYAAGLWMDTEFRGVKVENTTMAENYGAGIFVEASMGPIAIVKCKIYNNEQGVYISAVDSVTVDGCNIYDNIVQIGVYDHLGLGRGYKSEGQYDFADIDNHAEWRSHSIYAVIKNNRISNQSYNTTPLINQRGNDTIGYRNFMNTLTIENNNFIFGSSGTTPFYYKQGQKPYKVDVWRKD
jgi:parallel beta-helix repeat protein